MLMKKEENEMGADANDSSNMTICNVPKGTKMREECNFLSAWLRMDFHLVKANTKGSLKEMNCWFQLASSSCSSELQVTCMNS